MREVGRPSRRMRDESDRGQLSLSLVEAAVGVVFVLTVAASFGIAVSDPGTTEAQLDAYAADAATILANEPPERDETRTAGFDDGTAFEREGDALDRRVDRLLPDNLLYRVTTPAGTVGIDPPRGVTTGRATAVTPAGKVVVEVWYA